MTTLRDIAKMAGVSTATVSRIINGKGEASEETIKKVMDLVEEYNYRPNRIAKSLSQKSSNTIAILISNLVNPFFAELVTKIDEVASEHQLQILICNTNDQRSKVEQAINTIIDYYALGVIVICSQVELKDLETLENAGIHTVTLDRATTEHPFSSITINQEKSFFEATDYLTKQSCQNLLLLSGPNNLEMTHHRVNGFFKAVANHQIKNHYILEGDFTTDGAYQLVLDFMKKHLYIDGIIAANDLMALGAMRACRELGRQIPSDVKIIGNDNLSLDNYLETPLTSISQRKELISQKVIEQLLEQRKTKKTSKKNHKLILEGKLIIRKSSQVND
ncbi:LacI family DNA-binding transcriptional regulator [Streptococcus anginosus]|jgi:LacI family transcriptional regulator|uniref:LacI family transcriptional regulator n=3 Tax=Streptococcus anginosus TaxID=1328 RepID=A0AAW5TPC3_STRAP|nr:MULTISPECIES: LacI family DNA-binding transcriptional regulator [Streptococcus]DAL35024.1 MAG TPA_asm: Transcriptional regulator [Caudoviricetes sp.]KAA9261340.1 LacI family transcriptional regulator [Streptococcus anginosus]KAA9262305.1 LacI family transcriptional regulator [Streptococcus anginosus]KAA9270163.1 LacI family transcriptional regulator [Streptococcus anginosus]KAA9320860.1 LacI family transcriptional regulator [Streptococcus anginosus]